MLRGIPTAPLALGLAGLIPFVWGALTLLLPSLQGWGINNLGLSFMSGVLWGYATRASGRLQSAACYALSVIPALWAFFMTGGGPVSAGMNLIWGFLGLLLLDMMFSLWRLTPSWWVKLRLLLTSVVVLCLSVGVFL